MSQPQRLFAPEALVAQALARLAGLAENAGHSGWAPPEIAVDGERLEAAVALAGLDHGEALAVALLLAAECDASVARMIATLQAPISGACPLAGLVATLAAPDGVTVASLWSGAASRSGLIAWGNETAPLPERTLSMPAWLSAGLCGFEAMPPGTSEPAQPPVILPESSRHAIAAEGKALRQSVAARSPALLAIRTHCPAEGEALALVAAQSAGLRLCHLAEADAPGLATWLAIMGRLPMLHRNAGPGEAINLTPLDHIATPLVVVAGLDGQVHSSRSSREWRSPMPDEEERAALWRGWGLDEPSAAAAAARYRQGVGRIAEIGRNLAGGGHGVTLESLTLAMRDGGGRIDAMARRTTARVRRDDIVLTAELDSSLDRLRDRILLRNRLHEGLGPTIAARYKPGVRALFSGESGTGKTLAAHWLAEQAGLPCYRADLAQLTSKWIGETEKNLSQLLDAAEQGDVVLFFDEADSLFGTRTDVGDAHDRHANAQTNFLLQRIEEFEGVAILATNSRDRFDPAFVRRLDMVLEFPLPDAAARRELWERHLGSAHAVTEARLDLLAATVDLAGGHVRNIVLAAAARAKAQDRLIAETDLTAAIAEEYAKLGRTAPPLTGH